MNWFSSLLLALLTGAFALISAGFIMSLCVRWYRISSFEGGSGYAVIYVALLGGVAGTLIGLVTARLVAAGAFPLFLKGLGYSFGLVLVIGVISTWLGWSLAHIPPTIDGQELNLEVELMLPADIAESPATLPGESSLSLACVLNHVQQKKADGILKTAEARRENGRWIVPGVVPVFTMRGQRALEITLNGESAHGFMIPLPARPDKTYESWSDWSPRPPAGQVPWPVTKPSYRFRIQPRPTVVPPPDPAEQKAGDMAALASDAPLETWLAFLANFPPSETAAKVMAVIEQRPAELAAAIRRGENTTDLKSGEKSVRTLALIAVTNLRHTSPEVVAAVRDDGLAIAIDLERFNLLTDSAENYHLIAAALNERAFWWLRAWWKIHDQASLNSRPLVEKIRDLASVRSSEPSIAEILGNTQLHLDVTTPEASNAR